MACSIVTKVYAAFHLATDLLFRLFRVVRLRPSLRSGPPLEVNQTSPQVTVLMITPVKANGTRLLVPRLPLHQATLDLKKGV